ncbi:MAG: methionine aminotransferase [Saprospiraceae bacterium]|nr:methionine aminotransferase [Saprospiraceae bacterium]
MRIDSKLPNVGTTIFTVMSGLANQAGAINLSQGFPNYDPSPELQSLVSKHMASGGTQAIFCAIGAFVRPGDEVILIEPCYDSYRPSVETMGGVPVVYALSAPDYRVDWQELKKLVTPRTRMLCINTPQNPTGTILREEDMLELDRILQGTDVIVMSDEVYEHLIYDGEPHASVLRYPSLYQRSLAIYSFGKTYHNTGWKTGYCIAPPELTKEFRKVHQFNIFSANHPMQAAFADFMQHKDEYLGLPDFYQQKRDSFLQAMSGTRFRPLRCSGTYFQLFSYSDISDEGDLDFCKRLTTDFGVAAIPVSSFYSNLKDEKVVRLCFAKTEDLLEKAGKLLERV